MPNTSSHQEIIDIEGTSLSLETNHLIQEVSDTSNSLIGSDFSEEMKKIIQLIRSGEFEVANESIFRYVESEEEGVYIGKIVEKKLLEIMHHDDISSIVQCNNGILNYFRDDKLKSLFMTEKVKTRAKDVLIQAFIQCKNREDFEKIEHFFTRMDLSEDFDGYNTIKDGVLEEKNTFMISQLIDGISEDEETVFYKSITENDAKEIIEAFLNEGMLYEAFLILGYKNELRGSFSYFLEKSENKEKAYREIELSLGKYASKENSKKILILRKNFPDPPKNFPDMTEKMMKYLENHILWGDDLILSEFLSVFHLSEEQILHIKKEAFGKGFLNQNWATKNIIENVEKAFALKNRLFPHEVPEDIEQIVKEKAQKYFEKLQNKNHQHYPLDEFQEDMLYFLEITEQSGISKEVFTQTSVIEIMDAYFRYFGDRDTSLMSRFIGYFHITESQNSEIIIKQIYREYDLSHILQITKNPHFILKSLSNNERKGIDTYIRETIKEICNRGKRAEYKYIRDISEKFEISQDEIARLIFDGIKIGGGSVPEGTINLFLFARENGYIFTEGQNEEIHIATETKLEKYMNEIGSGEMKKIPEFIKTFGISRDKVTSILYEGICYSLDRNINNRFINLIQFSKEEDYHFSKEQENFIRREISENIPSWVSTITEKGGGETIKKISDWFDIPSTAFREKSLEGIHKSTFWNLMIIYDFFSSHYLLNTEEMEEVQKRAITLCEKHMISGELDLKSIKSMIHTFDIPLETIEQASLQALKKQILKIDQKGVKIILENFNFPESEKDYLDLVRAFVYPEKLNEKSEYREKVLSLLSKNQDPEIEDETIYCLALQSVYPKRNYNSYKYLDAYKNRNADLDRYVFDRNGYNMTLSGVTGYKIKEGVQKNTSILEGYKKRIQSIQGWANNPDTLLTFLEQSMPDSEAKTLEGKIMEYIRSKRDEKTGIDLLLAYQLRGGYDPFIRGSADNTEEYDTSEGKEYVMLLELSERYGDMMKETLKEIQEKLRNSGDAQIFGAEKGTISEKEGIDFSQGIREDLQKIPKEKLTTSIIQKKVVVFIKTKFQKLPDREKVAQIFSESFTLENFSQFENIFQSQFKELTKEIQSGLPIDLKFTEKLAQNSYEEIRQELDKYEEIKEVDNERNNEEKLSKERYIRGYFSKNRENAHARMVGDICIGTDPKMLENPHYFEYILFDEERTKCVGTVMLMEIKEEDGKKYLLYCPNPSVDLVSQVSAMKLYEKITERIKKFTKDNGYDAIILDKTHGKSTNRSGLFLTALQKSLLKNETGEEKTYHLSKEYTLGGGYRYKENLQCIWENTYPE